MRTNGAVEPVRTDDARCESGWLTIRAPVSETQYCVVPSLTTDE